MQKYSDFINEQKLFNPEFSNGQEIIIDEGLLDWIRRMWKKFTNWLNGKKDSNGRYRLSHWPDYRDWDRNTSSGTKKGQNSKNNDDEDKKADIKIPNQSMSFNEFEKENKQNDIVYDKLNKIKQFSSASNKNGELLNFNLLNNSNEKGIDEEYKFTENNIYVNFLLYGPPEDPKAKAPVAIFVYVNKVFECNDIKYVYVIDCEMGNIDTSDNNKKNDNVSKLNEYLKRLIDDKNNIITSDINYLIFPKIPGVEFTELKYNNTQPGAIERDRDIKLPFSNKDKFIIRHYFSILELTTD